MRCAKNLLAMNPEETAEFTRSSQKPIAVWAWGNTWSQDDPTRTTGNFQLIRSLANTLMTRYPNVAQINAARFRVDDESGNGLHISCDDIAVLYEGACRIVCRKLRAARREGFSGFAILVDEKSHERLVRSVLQRPALKHDIAGMHVAVYRLENLIEAAKLKCDLEAAIVHLVAGALFTSEGASAKFRAFMQNVGASYKVQLTAALGLLEKLERALMCQFNADFGLSSSPQELVTTVAATPEAPSATGDLAADAPPTGPAD